MNTIVRYLRRFTFAFAGVFYAIRTDFSFRTQLILGTVTVIIVNYLFWPLTTVELLFLILSLFLILITELQNSAFEAALNRLHPEIHQEIGRSKDMAAGAVLLAGGFLLAVLAIISYNHLVVLI